jgi:hypothetical protein
MEHWCNNTDRGKPMLNCTTASRPSKYASFKLLYLSQEAQNAFHLHEFWLELYSFVTLITVTKKCVTSLHQARF